MKNKLYMLLVFIMLLTTGCGSLYESNESGYTQVTSVNGVVFDMPSNFLSQATAITSIGEDIDYSNGTYLYKNGKDKYLMFNINDVIIAVQSGTNFDMKNTKNKSENMENSGICEVWLTPDKKLDYDEQTKGGVYKMIGNANADVSITSSVYGELIGNFAIVQYEDFECAIFAGVPYNEDGLTNNQKKILNHIVKSITIDKDYVDLFGEKTEEETTLSVSEAPVFSEEDNTEEIIVEENTEVEEIIVEDTEVEEIVVEEETETIDSTESTEISVIEEVETEEIVGKEEPSSQKPEDKKQNANSIESNQSEATNGYSDIYHMLSVGNKGFLNTVSNNGKDLIETHVTTNKLYTGQDAIDIIKSYCKTKECPYKYEDAPAGYSWHVMEYTLEKAPTDLYVNVKILGLDGEKLKFRGIAASSRTYDIFSFAEKDASGYVKAYCYYAVPNGCKEYMLEYGTRYTETGGTACYKITDY